MSQDFACFAREIKKLVLQTAELDVEKYIDQDFSTIGINSIQYIRIIVAIEQEYNMEFSDDSLLEGYFTSFEQLVDYVADAIGLSLSK
ncbi:MAG: hypothetical protein DDT40_01732 [candidate division WS2 bacterium]|nr:hypothetical protein [Candidatus Psychracetigena formicireducens]